MICFVAGLVRLGFLADLLSRPVLVGYMTGVALIMIASQLGKVTVSRWRATNSWTRCGHSSTGWTECTGRRSPWRRRCWWCCWLLARLAPRLPGPLIAILLAGASWSACFRWTATESRWSVTYPPDCRHPASRHSARRLGGPVDPGRRHRDRGILRQRVDRPHIRGPPWPRHGRQRRTACTGRVQRRCRSARTAFR